MKYTIPYEDKINLPHIKELLSIDLKAGKIEKNEDELISKVIVYGEYTLDNSEDVMEFTHEIPISLLVDDTDIEPVISFSNFEYELVKGRSVEIMFDLDVTIESREEQFQKEVDEKLDEVISEKQPDAFASINEELSQQALHEDGEELVDEKEEAVKEVEENIVSEDIEVEVRPEDEEEVEMDSLFVQDDEDELVQNNELHPEENERDQDDEDELLADLDLHLEDDLRVNLEEEVMTDDGLSVDLDNMLDETYIEEDEVGEDGIHDVSLFEEENEEMIDSPVQVRPSDEEDSFDIGFISSAHDKFTTYKVLLLEEEEDLDKILEEKGLSKDLIVDGFDRNSRKVVLKIDDE